MNLADLKSFAPVDVQFKDIQEPLEENLKEEEICEMCDNISCKYSSNFVEVDLEDNLYF